MVRFRYCYYCGKALSRYRATKDHVVPRSKGGSDHKHNIVDACRRCNSEKGCLTPEEFRVIMAFRAGFVKIKGFKFPGERLREDDF